MNKAHVYQDSAGEWRWRVVNTQNGKIVANGGEAFWSKYDAERAVDTLIPGIEIVADPPEEVV